MAIDWEGLLGCRDHLQDAYDDLVAQAGEEIFQKEVWERERREREEEMQRQAQQPDCQAEPDPPRVEATNVNPMPDDQPPFADYLETDDDDGHGEMPF